MRDWHFKHMETIIVKFVKGLSPCASSKEKLYHKKYVNIFNVCREINNDIKHGVKYDEVMLFLQKIQNDPSYSDLQKDPESVGRMDALKKSLQI